MKKLSYDTNTDYFQRFKDTKDKATADEINTIIKDRFEKQKALGQDPNDSAYNEMKDFVDNMNNSNNQENKKEDPNDYISQLATAQQKATAAALGKAYNSNLSNLSNEKAQIAPMYYDKRNQTSTSSQVGARNLAEYMANRGQTNSGASIQSEINRQGALQTNIGSLNTSEANANTDISRRMTDLQNAYNSDLASNEANIQSGLMQNLLNQYNLNTQNQANYLGMYNGQQTMAGQQNQSQLNSQSIQDQINQLNLSALPQQIKDQAALIQQQLTSGNLSNQEAQFRLEQLKNSVNNTVRPNTSGYSYNATKTSTNDTVGSADYKQFENEIYTMMNSDPALASQYIQANKDAIIREIGKTGYNALLKSAKGYVGKDIDLRRLL